MSIVDTVVSPSPNTLDPALLETLDTIQQRVSWLATSMIHHANSVRPNQDGSKIGGHQASSASMITIMTALYFHFLHADDRIAIKPHASPVFHAIQYLLGQLPQRYLTTLREFGGLQAYPSRTKDADHVDFSTGSVGLGAVAPAFAALAQRYAQAHFGKTTAHRFIALMGDAELDEGNIWEAVLDEALRDISNVIWIVDLNRQSLDRVVPGIRATQLKDLFSHSGWQVLEAKYGCKLQAAFARPGGAALRERIDSMSNEEYQALIRLPADQARQRLTTANGVENAAVASAIAALPDSDLPDLLANLGGHDFEELLRILAQAEADLSRPTVILAYTIKGWGLPMAGHPLNHSMLLSAEQMAALQAKHGVVAGSEWAGFAPDSAAGKLCTQATQRLYAKPTPVAPTTPVEIPASLGVPASEATSTQETFGRLLTRLADVPGLNRRIVTTSPDVSVSTNLAGWINKFGVFSPNEHPEYDPEAYRLMRWRRGPTGQHIELGISEMNLFMLLAMLGLSAELCGQQLVPIGTVYDPFVCRGLDALIYGLYSGAKFIVAGTPSGVTLAPEGGAHQSTVTPSLGSELPKLHAYEPCYARELEWTLLEAIGECYDRLHGRASYFRLSTKPVSQVPFDQALQRLGEPTLRQHVLAGGYRLIDAQAAAVAAEPGTTVQIAAVGAMIPEAVAAAQLLQREGVAANVLNLVSPRRLFETWRQSDQHKPPFDWLIPADEHHAPIITVQDGASHALAWLGSVYGARVTSLGVDDFGQSGTRADLYRHFGINAESIAEAAFSALEHPNR